MTTNLSFDPAYKALTRTIAITDEIHQMGHDGFVYHCSGKITGVLNAGVVEFLIEVPVSTFPHLDLVNFTVGAGDIDIDTFEGPTNSSSGTPLLAFNTNRNSANTPDTVINISPTITGDGTQVHLGWVAPTASGVGQSQGGVAGTEQGEEWVLKPSTDYLIRLTNNSGATIDIRYEYRWYEIAF